MVEGDAAALPFDDGSFDLVLAFMSLMDIDDMDRAVREAVRVLEAYTGAFEDAGLVIETLRELQGVRRPHLPISLHLHAVRA